jgi:hypothetical protein
LRAEPEIIFNIIKKLMEKKVNIKIVVVIMDSQIFRQKSWLENFSIL